jgi:hypothetical protein
VMIDKVELRVPYFTRYTADFGRLYQELRNDRKGPFGPSRHYLSVADLREYGHPVILHTHNVHDKKGGNFKLELIETGDKSYRDMEKEISRIFDTGAGSLRLMRVDLAADVPDVPVSWFQQNIRARFKRWTAEIGAIEYRVDYSAMGRRGVETFYLGKRPNVIRIYNKVAERQHRYSLVIARQKRKHTPTSELPTFEQMFGHPASGVTLTRVERQIAGGRVPEQLATFHKLHNAAEFDPFENLVYIGVGKREPNPDDYELTEYLTGMQIRSLVEREGIHRFLQFANKHSKRNGSRLLRQYADFLPSDGCFISPKGLRERFRESVSKQLAA